MISSVQYQILKDLQNGKPVSDGKHFNEILVLRQKGYLALIIGQGYVLQGDWLKEVEEYESAQASKALEAETLDIAKEANEIAKDANQISIKANKKSKHANVISWIAIGVSVLSIVASVLCAIFF